MLGTPLRRSAIALISLTMLPACREASTSMETHAMSQKTAMNARCLTGLRKLNIHASSCAVLVAGTASSCSASAARSGAFKAATTADVWPAGVGPGDVWGFGVVRCWWGAGAVGAACAETLAGAAAPAERLDLDTCSNPL